MSARRTTQRLAAALVLVLGSSAAAACDPGPAQPAAVSGGADWWRTDLDAVPAGTAEQGSPTAEALARQWSHHGQGQERDYGLPTVIAAGRDGLPAPPTGDATTIRLAHEPGDPATQRKLYKSFSARNWPAGTEPFSQDDGSPRDVSGRYIAYQYVSSAQLRLTDQGWMNLAQLKEGYATDAGVQTSDPSWWLVLYHRDGRLFLDLAHWKEGRIAGAREDFAPYLDRWLKIEMRVYQNDRVEVYLNDTLFDVGYQRQYPVGRMHHVGAPVDGEAATVTREEGWIFGVGNYSNPSDPASGSLVHVGHATVQPLP